MGPLGNTFVSDIETGKIFKVRASHYPADVTVEMSGLKAPMGIIFLQGILYVANSGGNGVAYKDTLGTTILDPTNKL